MPFPKVVLDGVDLKAALVLTFVKWLTPKKSPNQIRNLFFDRLK
jgi:hypothetical protein